MFSRLFCRVQTLFYCVNWWGSGMRSVPLGNGAAWVFGCRLCRRSRTPCRTRLSSGNLRLLWILWAKFTLILSRTTWLWFIHEWCDVFVAGKGRRTRVKGRFPRSRTCREDHIRCSIGYSCLKKTKTSGVCFIRILHVVREPRSSSKLEVVWVVRKLRWISVRGVLRMHPKTWSEQDWEFFIKIYGCYSYSTNRKPQAADLSIEV